MIASPLPDLQGGDAPRPYAARPADPRSPHDVATLALMRWWSVTVSDPRHVDMTSLPAFHRQFVSWWEADEGHRLAVLVEEVDHTVRVPVAMGWVVPVEAVPQPVRREAQPARPEAVYVVPGARSSLALDTLRRGLEALAQANGLSLTGAALP